MKKAFLVLIAVAAVSFTACKSGKKGSESMDSTAMQNMTNEAIDSVKSMPAPAPADTTHMMYTTKKM
jgi:hypothetical protein